MTVKLKIEEIGAGGDGIGHQDNEKYYVPFTAPGDIVFAKINKKQGDGYLADLVEIIEPSSHRIKARCKHFGTCGGCNLQQVDNDFLSDWKSSLIPKSLDLAGITDYTINPTITSPEYSRRRVEFVASKRKKGVMIGYHVRKSHQIFDVGECPLITPTLKALIQPMRQMLGGIMPRNSQARLTLTDCDNGPDLKITTEQEISLKIREDIAAFANEHKLSRVSWYDKTSAIEEIICALKPTEILMGGIPVPLSSGGFLQATQEGQESLIGLTMDQLEPDTRILDLFAGCGSFSLPATQKVSSVVAVENEAGLVSSLTHAANKHMLSVKALQRDLFRQPLTPNELDEFDCIVIDPPRAGATAQVQEIALSNVEKIIFISCNPASFARDARRLLDAGYVMHDITPIDQFRWSHHVELFTTFTKG